jgi:hypothetical protein
MELKTEGRAFGRKGWTRMILSTLTVLVLLPVPALALTFLTDWDIRTETRNAPSPTVLAGDTSSQGTFFQVNFGENTRPQVASALVTGVRDFAITTDRQAVGFFRSVEALLENSSINFGFRIVNLANQREVLSFRRSEDAGPVRTRFNELVGFTANLARGSYQITLDVGFEKTAAGSWDNTGAIAGQGSPFQFEFLGI